ncbi:hypothetical protein Tco_0030030 [Tanacetum coccineum]
MRGNTRSFMKPRSRFEFCVINKSKQVDKSSNNGKLGKNGDNFTKNVASTSGTYKNAKVVSMKTVTLNPFDALNSVKNDDVLGSNEGNAKMADIKTTKTPKEAPRDNVLATISCK